MSARKDLAAALKPLLPRGWQIIDHERSLDTIKKIAVLISQREIEPAPNAQGSHRVTFRVYVISPHTALDAAEDALDDAVDSLLFALDKVDPVRWTAARKIIHPREDRLAYELTIEAFTIRKD